MKKLFVICLGAAVLLLPGCKKTSILVNKIEIDPGFAKLFPGEEQEFVVKCTPSTATNLEDLTVSILDPSVANFENGKLVAKKPSYTYLQAQCGAVSAQAFIRVYSGWFTKGGMKYGVDRASGYYFYWEESTPHSMDLTLTCYTGEMEGEWEVTQSFWLTIPYNRLGEEINFLEDMQDCQVSVQRNNNEDGYCIYYNEDLGCPVVKEADWGDTDAVLTKGLLTVTLTDTDTFSVSADFALSNGYTFTAEWEGSAAMQQE